MGARHRPVASQDVAIQKIPSCTCQVRASEIGHPVCQGDPIECRALYSIVGGGHAGRHLYKEQSANNPEILGRRLHRRCGLDTNQRIFRHRRVCAGPCAPGCRIEPGQRTDPAQKQDETADRHHDDQASRPVPNKLFRRPVVRVRNVAAGSVGPAGPCRPEKESREIAPARVALYGVGRHRIALAKRIQLGVTAKEARIVALNRADGLRPKCRHLNCLRSGIVRVGSELSLQSCPKRSLPFPVQFLISLIEFARRPLV